MWLIGLALFCAVVYGWVMNIVWMVHQQVWIWSGESILSVVGLLIAPLGAIMGYVH